MNKKFGQVLAGLKKREAAGVILPKYLVLQTLSDLQNTASSPARSTLFYTALADKVKGLPDVSKADKTALLAAAEKEITGSVLPAFQALANYFKHLETIATDDAGVWKFPDGEAYYTFLLRHHTSTDLTAAEIHALGKKELERIHSEMRAVFDQLGYPQETSLADLYARVGQAGGVVPADQVVSYCEALIQLADEKVRPALICAPRQKSSSSAGRRGATICRQR